MRPLKASPPRHSRMPKNRLRQPASKRMKIENISTKRVKRADVTNKRSENGTMDGSKTKRRLTIVKEYARHLPSWGASDDHEAMRVNREKYERGSHGAA